MKYKIITLLILSILLITVEATSQYKQKLLTLKQVRSVSGNLYNDLILSRYNLQNDGIRDTAKVVNDIRKYSPLTAGLLSAGVPGAGQFYTKNYWQSAAFFGAEVLLWITYAIYEDRGDQRTRIFEEYADEHWSVVRYAYWIKNSTEYQGYFRNGIFIGTPPSTDVSQPWNYINFDELNLCEEEIGGLDTKTGFSHRLEKYGDQQYYEMIGKYPQFGGGWDDASSFTENDIRSGNVSQNFLKYSQMRGDANSAYNIATTVSYVIMANHLFSALEAALNASRINHKVHLEGHIQSRLIYSNLVEFVPTFNLSIGL